MSERTRRITRPGVATLIVSLLVAVAYWSPAWMRLHATGFGDWQMVHHNWEVGYVALTRFSEWPLWNPFFCGGITAFGNPESQWFSPLTWLSLFTGTTIGTKLFLTLHATIGLAGMYVFARREVDLRVSASMLVAAAWGCSGFFAWHGAGGHATFLPFYFAPWLLLSWRRMTTDLRYAIAVAALLSLTLYEGGTYPFPYFVLWLGVDWLLTVRARRAVPLRAIAVVGVLTALLGAIRWLPIRDALSQLPRDTVSDDSIRFSEMLEMLTARDHAWRYPPHRFVWPEYGTFIGWTVIALACIGIVIAWRRKQRWIIGGLVVFLLLVSGEGGPWTWLHHLPVFDSLRVPSRFMVLVTFYLALLSGLGLDAIGRFLATHRGNAPLGWVRYALVPIALVLAVTDLFVVNLKTIDRWSGPPTIAGPAAEHFQLLRANNVHALYASLPARHQGTAACYNGGMNWVVSPSLWSGEVPQVRALPADAGELVGFERTANTVTLRVRAVAAQTRFVINQNFDRDFQASVGNVVAERGLLAVDVPTGEHEILVRYQPRTLAPGLWLTGFGWALSLAGWWRLSRRLSTGSV